MLMTLLQYQKAQIRKDADLMRLSRTEETIELFKQIEKASNHLSEDRDTSSSLLILYDIKVRHILLKVYSIMALGYDYIMRLERTLIQILTMWS